MNAWATAGEADKRASGLGLRKETPAVIERLFDREAKREFHIRFGKKAVLAAIVCVVDCAGQLDSATSHYCHADRYGLRIAEAVVGE